MVGHKQKIWFFLRLCGQFGWFFLTIFLMMFSDAFLTILPNKAFFFDFLTIMWTIWMIFLTMFLMIFSDAFLTILPNKAFFFDDCFRIFFSDDLFQFLECLCWLGGPTWRLNTLFKDVLALDRSCFSVRIDFTFSKRYLTRQKFVKF